MELRNLDPGSVCGEISGKRWSQAMLDGRMLCQRDWTAVCIKVQQQMKKIFILSNYFYTICDPFSDEKHVYLLDVLFP